MIHEHHRKRRRGKATDNRPVNLIGLPDVIHQWIHDNPEKAYKTGLLVHQEDDPAEIPVTIPEEALKKARTPRTKTEKARTRVNVQIRVPKDDREDGAGIFDDLLQQCRERLEDEIATGGKSSDYIVLTAVMHDWLTD